MIRKERFEALLKQIEIKFGRGSSAEWKNRDFEDLNFEINKKTKITISALTLKRIFGKIKTEEDYLPQKATLKALEQYANFEPKKSITATEKEEEETTDVINTLQEIEPAFEPKTALNAKLKIAGIAVVSFFIIMGVYFLINQQKAYSNQSKSGTIELIKAEGSNPKTAFFEYTTPNASDSFFIWFDEAYKPLHIANGKLKTTYYFQYPGLYKVRMMTREQSVSDTIPVFVETNGWQALGYYFDQEYNKRYYPIKIDKTVHDSVFHPTKKDLYLSGMDTAKITVLRFDNFRSTGVNGDNFTLETTLKNPDEWTGVRCNSIFLYVEGKNGTIRFRFANPGCSYWIDYEISEKKINNQNEDLSTFTFDLSEWQEFKIENKNKNIDISINNKKRFSDNYNKSIGEIIGVTVLFHGNGYVKKYLLMDKQKNIIFTYQP